MSGRRSRVVGAALAVATLVAGCSSTGGKAAARPPVKGPCTGGATAEPPLAGAVAKSLIPANVKAQTAPITVRCRVLAPLPEGSVDTEVGKAAPIVTGTTFSGRQLTIGRRGHPYLVLFVAHWCPHCRAEVPLLAPWLRAGGMPKGFDVFTVATGTRPSYPNYPPSDWLRREAWPTEVVADSDQQAAASAYGLTAYPFFVVVDGKGKVVSRFSGETPIRSLARELQGVR